METHRRQKASSTGDIFTFPAMSPDTKFESELADQLFFNGKFLLHDFPVQPTSFNIPRSMIMSRTSSISSKSSLMSSRSNSTNSRTSSTSSSNSTSNSSCTSARTSTSETYCLKKKLATINQAKCVATKTTETKKRLPNKERQRHNYCNKYSHSQRWQFIAPTPVLNRRNSLKKRKAGKGKRDGGVRKGICRRFFGWLVSTCQECHAIEPSKRMKVRM